MGKGLSPDGGRNSAFQLASDDGQLSRTQKFCLGISTFGGIMYFPRNRFVSGIRGKVEIMVRKSRNVSLMTTL